MDDATIPAQVHRLRDHVAVYLGNGETVYIRPIDARTIAFALNECAHDIENIPNFSHSQFGSMEWQFKGKR
jgi:hypothetical protein